MNPKENFTPDEWALLIKAPMMVSYSVIGAAPSGGVGFVKEMKAVADAIVDTSEQAPAGSLIQAVAGEIRSNATDELRGPTETIPLGEITNMALELCRQVAQIMQSKTSDEEARSYKLWLLSVGKSVAEAAKEGGFLVFGGTRVNESEMTALSEIASALGINLSH
ncbi:MAG TPA: hypothetical protein VJZ26_05515 [Blastocatellia bacterium]|nr:hypothetical protein [Blastocatellia bacterium]